MCKCVCVFRIHTKHTHTVTHVARAAVNGKMKANLCNELGRLQKTSICGTAWQRGVYLLTAALLCSFLFLSEVSTLSFEFISNLHSSFRFSLSAAHSPAAAPTSFPYFRAVLVPSHDSFAHCLSVALSLARSPSLTLSSLKPNMSRTMPLYWYWWARLGVLLPVDEDAVCCCLSSSLPPLLPNCCSSALAPTHTHTRTHCCSWLITANWLTIKECRKCV